MWKFEFDAPRGCRIMKGFWGVTTYDKSWSPNDGMWVDRPQGISSTHHFGPKSFKAFKRYLRKHPELQECDEVVLVYTAHAVDNDGNYMHGYGIKAKWED